jgi:hypothetical protein
MSTHGEMMDATYLRRLLDTQKVSPPESQNAKQNLRLSSPMAKRAGIQTIDVGWLSKRDEIHAVSLFCNVKEMKH